MRVLVACEFSGVVRDAFIRHGHDAISCDIIPSDRPGSHYQGDVRNILRDGWDLMVAHPPCTYLCSGGNNWLNRRPDLRWRENRIKAAGFFMELMDAPIPRIAVENPIGCMSSMYRKPDQIVRPWMFGHPYRKDICLWLKNLPLLCPTHLVAGREKLDFWSDKRNPNRRSLKSVTFEGVAEAMASQWGGV
jgi:hypothetical protein